MVSLVEPGDRVVVGECGRFGLLLIEIAERCGADVVPVRAEWGRIIEPDAIAAALGAAPRTRLVAMIHGETSTGVLQPLEEIAALCRRHDALLMADAVVTLGGARGRHRSLAGGRHGGGRAEVPELPLGALTRSRTTRAPRPCWPDARARCASNYLDLIQLARYWSPARFNHHTAPTSMVYGLREALRAVQEEGLAARFARHRLHGDALRAGIAALGLRLFGAEPPARRLPMITPVVVPDGIDELRVRRELIQDFGLEIGAAFGPLRGTHLAHRHHGPCRPAPERAPLPRGPRARARADRAGARRPAPGSTRPSRTMRRPARRRPIDVTRQPRRARHGPLLASWTRTR